MSQDKPLPQVTPSRHHDRELWVGAFVILGIVAILVALFTMTDAALFRGRYILQTRVPDAGGIRRGDPVQLRGVNIGRVTRFVIGPGGVVVSLEIEGEYSFPVDSRVELRSSGLLGGMVATVVPGTSDTEAGWGDVLPGYIEKGVFEEIDQVQQQADRALDRVQRLLDEETVANVHASGRDLRQLLRQLVEVSGEQRGELAALTGSLRRSAAALEQTVTGPEVGRSARRLESLVGRLDSVAARLDRSSRSAESILARLAQGQGTLGRLVADEALYDNVSAAAASIRQAADELTRLTADIRAQPEKYVQVSVF